MNWPTASVLIAANIAATAVVTTVSDARFSDK